MTTKATPSHDTLTDSQPIVWIVAGLFAFVGACFLALAVQETARGHVGLPVAGALLAAIIGLVSAGYAARTAERLTLDLDRLRRTVTLTGRLPWRRRSTTWRFTDVAGVEVEEDQDSDGDPIWRTVLVLRAGDRVPLMANWRHDREHCERYRDTATAALGR